jgi:uncharacterized membrane protein YuzA (DUF378 family)
MGLIKLPMTNHKHGMLDQLNGVDRAAGAMLALGAVNWGLVGAANFDAIRAVLGRSTAARAAYTLVGLSAGYAVARGKQLSRR